MYWSTNTPQSLKLVCWGTLGQPPLTVLIMLRGVPFFRSHSTCKYLSQNTTSSHNCINTLQYTNTHHVTHISCRHTTASTHCSTHTHSCYAHCMSSHNCINTLQCTYLLQTHVTHILCHHTTASTHCSTQTHTCHIHVVTQMHQHTSVHIHIAVTHTCCHTCINTLQYTYT